MLEFLADLGGWEMYPLLCLVAFADTLAGVGFFVFGEAAFLLSGVRLAANGDILLAVLVLAAAWAGDMTSYVLGRRFGRRAARRGLGRLKRRRQWRRASGLLLSRGAAFVVAARLLGPLAWITPFLAGTAGMPAGRFAAASAAGVMLGGGQFIVLGYLGVQGLPLLGRFLAPALQHWQALALLGAVLAAAGLIWHLSPAGCIKRGVYCAGAAVTVFLTANLYYFFASDAHAANGDPGGFALQDHCQLAGLDLRAYPGSTRLHLPQPVNVILLSRHPPEALMANLGWLQNKTFTRNAITLPEYVRLLIGGTPPVSELYLNGLPARSAFQLPGTLSERLHIRWWHAGQAGGRGIYLGAISKDDEIAIKYYGAIPALLHDIDPDVDRARDLLRSQIEASADFKVSGTAPLLQPVQDSDPGDYRTDGKVLVVSDSTGSEKPHHYECLGLPGKGEV